MSAEADGNVAYDLVEDAEFPMISLATRLQHLGDTLRQEIDSRPWQPHRLAEARQEVGRDNAACSRAPTA
jgi:hypothetical protein